MHPTDPKLIRLIFLTALAACLACGGMLFMLTASVCA